MKKKTLKRRKIGQVRILPNLTFILSPSTRIEVLYDKDTGKYYVGNYDFASCDYFYDTQFSTVKELREKLAEKLEADYMLAMDINCDLPDWKIEYTMRNIKVKVDNE